MSNTHDIQLPDWSKRAEHLKRSTRNASDIDLELSWVNEAYADPGAVIFNPDFASITGKGIRTIGYSETAGFCITIITVLEDGHLWGASAWKSSKSDTGRYERKA
jgi:hypothetical protein